MSLSSPPDTRLRPEHDAPVRRRRRRSRWSRFKRRARRWTRRRTRAGWYAQIAGVIALVVAIPIAIVWVQARRVESDLKAVRSHLELAERSLAEGDVDAASAEVAAARGRSSAALHASSNGVLGVIHHLPVIGNQSRAVASLSRAADNLVSAANIFVGGARKAPLLADHGSSLAATNLRTVLDGLQPAVTSLDAADAMVGRAHDALDGDSGWLIAPLGHARRDAKERLVDVSDRIETASALIKVGRQLTEPGKTTRLLLLSQDTWELRPSGGFIGSYGIVELRDGEMHLVSYEDATELPSPSQPYEPFATFAETLGGPVDITGAGWWPDFPTSARAAQELFLRQGGTPVDGVIAMTQHVLEELMPAFGDVTVPGYPDVLTAENVADRILYHVELKRPLDTPRKKFLKLLTEEIFDKLGHLDREHVPTAAKSLGTALRRRDLQLYLNDPIQQRALARANWAGELRAPASGDLFSLVDANWGNDKANQHVRRDIRYYVSWVDGAPTAEVTTVIHHDGPSSPVNPSYRSYVRMYAPVGSKLLGDRVERFGTTVSHERGLTTFARDKVVSVDAAETIRARYRLPPGVIVDGHYRLTVVPQAGTSEDTIEVVINLDGSPRSFDVAPGSGTAEILTTARDPSAGIVGRFKHFLRSWRGSLRR